MRGAGFRGWARERECVCLERETEKEREKETERETDRERRAGERRGGSIVKNCC